MKKLHIIPTIFLSLMMTSVAYAKWTEVGKNVVGDTYYVDFERIKKDDGKVYYYELIDFAKPLKNGEVSIKEYREAECGPFRHMWINFKSYNGPMASGTIIGSDVNTKRWWTYPDPDTVAEYKLKAVCNHKN